MLLGMVLDVTPGNLDGIPLGGFAVVKLLNEDGKVCYVAAATAGGMTSVECLGLAEWAVLKLKHGLTAEFGDGEEE